jgi:hypothetical protein
MISSSGSTGVSCTAIVLCIVASCGDTPSGQTAGWRGARQSLPGGGAHVINPDEPAWDSASAWRLVEDLRIGSVDSAGPTLFARINDIATDARGNIYVLERETLEVRVFDHQGRHVRSFGGEGGGPGEFKHPVAFHVFDDGHLLVVDYANARYSLFDSAGTHVESHARQYPASSFPWPGGVDAQGRVYEWLTPPDLSGTESDLLVRFHPGQPGRDTFPIATRESEQFVTTITGGGRLRVTVPFAAAFRWRIDFDRERFWWTLTDQYRLHQTTLAGDTVLIVDKAFEPIPVSGAERAKAIESLSWVRDQGGRFDASRIPDTRPAISSFLIDVDGNAWVWPTLVQGHAFDVFDAEGRYLGRVPLDEPLNEFPVPEITRDAIIGVVRDSLGVPFVVRLRIQKGTNAERHD